MIDFENYFATYVNKKKDLKNRSGDFSINPKGDRKELISYSTTILEDAMNSVDDISTKGVIPECKLSINPKSFKPFTEYEIKKEVKEDKKGNKKIVSVKTVKKPDYNEGKFTGNFTVTKGEKKIVGGKLNTLLFYDNKKESSILIVEAGLHKKDARKLRRKCHDYDFGMSYPNVKVDKDGIPYHLWWNKEGLANNIECTATESFYSKGELFPVCKFWKSVKISKDKEWQPGSKHLFNAEAAPIVIFEDVDTYFDCELREYDHNGDWYNTAMVCSPKNRAVQSLSAKVKK